MQKRMPRPNLDPWITPAPSNSGKERLNPGSPEKKHVDDWKPGGGASQYETSWWLNQPSWIKFMLVRFGSSPQDSSGRGENNKDLKAVP